MHANLLLFPCSICIIARYDSLHEDIVNMFTIDFNKYVYYNLHTTIFNLMKSEVFVMICCTFAGHRKIFSNGTKERIRIHLELLIEKHQEICFYCGGMGEFDILCAHEAKRLKVK